jgi:hypothetical protein
MTVCFGLHFKRKRGMSGAVFQSHLKGLSGDGKI